ncbi:MAG TPA: hypothetical protein VNC11_12310 [Gemmatimonadaceae bacterium]|jgi:hypothetical protein|nr:hypothetical protein [Gemmatimonadaceae bacterium]
MSDKHHKWITERPHTLVVACSDGRLQQQTDAFLTHQLGLTGFDRFYVPGGGGALASSGRDFIRAEQLRRECQYLIRLHEVSRVILLFHGPAISGPPESICADYHRKFPWGTPEMVREQQARDAIDLIERSTEWALDAAVSAYRCEIDADHRLAFVQLDHQKT